METNIEKNVFRFQFLTSYTSNNLNLVKVKNFLPNSELKIKTYEIFRVFIDLCWEKHTRVLNRKCAPCLLASFFYTCTTYPSRCKPFFDGKLKIFFLNIVRNCTLDNENSTQSDLITLCFPLQPVYRVLCITRILHIHNTQVTSSYL